MQNIHTIEYNKEKITFFLIRSKRKTIQLSINLQQEIIVKAPLTSSLKKIQDIIIKKISWINEKILYFKDLETKYPSKKFVSQEEHLFLGNKYILKIINYKENRVFIKDSYLYIYSNNSVAIEQLLLSWYREQANYLFAKVYHDLWLKYEFKENYNKPIMKIKNMKTRWGSLSSRGFMSLNLQLIKTKIICLKYVITHELCHLVHQNHQRGFYQLFTEIFPNWRVIKKELESYHL